MSQLKLMCTNNALIYDLVSTVVCQIVKTTGRTAVAEIWTVLVMSVVRFLLSQAHSTS